MLLLVSIRLMTTYTTVKAHAADRADQLLRDERGEIGSWMILAAGLAVAAAAAVAILGPWFNTKATDITNN